MGAIEEKIIDGLRELFPEMEDLAVTGNTRLEEIPGYDSMAAVNLQAYLEEIFRTKVLLEILNGETTISELVACLNDAGKMISAMRRQ